ncbi:MAG: hypothetical protein MK226_24330 [Saprospiraceae bacterium]|nr:hypothetical protein [Saprospiraceae bacterium]
MDKTAWELILPEGMLDYFEVTSVDCLEDRYSIYLLEKNLLSGEFEGLSLESKGFYDQITVKDFPLRGKACYLHVKRRRWLDKSSSRTISRDWKLLANGTRLTREFADFLKALYR